MPGDLPHVREKSPGIFLFISYLMYKEIYISFSPGEVPLCLFIHKGKFSKICQHHICVKIYKIKNQFFVLLLKEKKKIDNFLTTKSVYDTIFSSS